MEYDTLIPQCSIADADADDVELEGWKHAIGSGAVKVENLQEAVFASQFMFPNIHATLKVLLTMPECREIIQWPLTPKDLFVQ